MKRVLGSMALLLSLTLFSAYAQTPTNSAMAYDFAEVCVNVIRHTPEQETTLYSGPLSGFADGKFSGLDFSECQYAVISDWNGTDTMYIIPTTSKIETSSIASASNEQNLTVSDDVAPFAAGTITTNVALAYDGVYCENVILPEHTLNVSIHLENSGGQEKVSLYVAKYTLSGILTELKWAAEDTVPANGMLDTDISLDFSKGEACTAQIFVWQTDRLRSLSKNIEMTVTPKDYYPSEYTQAITVDFPQEMRGVINAKDDIDVVKFSPNASGLYAISLSASDTTLCEVRDSFGNLLSSVSSVTDNNFLIYSFSKGQTYYIRLNGNNQSNYTIKPSSVQATTKVNKNIGLEKETTEYDVYTFVPAIGGEYIITAVGSTGVKASLYNENFQFLASFSASDNDVSFRITNTFEANKTYYILVSPKAEGVSETYTLYVEEPFAITDIR